MSTPNTPTSPTPTSATPSPRVPATGAGSGGSGPRRPGVPGGPGGTSGENRRVIILSALGLILVIMAVLLVLQPGSDDGTPAAATPTAPATAEPTAPEATESAAPELSEEEMQAQRDAFFLEIVRRDPTDPTAIGVVDAPVVMIMWADFRCGYCAKFALETAPQLADYVTNGTLRIEWRDFPRVTEQSAAIAAAARAAGLQGKFWEYHDRVFADQATVEVMGDDYLRSVATDLGLDVARFDTDRVSVDVTSAVEADALQGDAIGVSGTPAFVINGTAIGGAQPIETFVGVIESELARATS